MSKVTSDIHEQIWKLRVHRYKLWLEAEGVTKKDFKTYFKKFKRPTRKNRQTISNTPRARSHTITSPAPRFFAHYEEWIRWTSSNFRHNSTSLFFIQHDFYTIANGHP